MKIAIASLLAILVSTLASLASLRYGPTAGLVPLTGYGAALIWYAHRHPKDWDT